MQPISGQRASSPRPEQQRQIQLNAVHQEQKTEPVKKQRPYAKTLVTYNDMYDIQKLQ